ncbi:MAG TPA: trehalose-6-phosphate synthase, partial [Gaiellaceae bacterium]
MAAAVREEPLLTRRALIVVSNRGPVSYGRDERGERTVSRGGGGLATALRNLVRDNDVTWIAAAMTDEDRAVAHEPQDEVVLLDIPKDTYARYYTVAANPTLWFLQHSLWNLGLTPDFDHDAWANGYVPVNTAMARATLDELTRRPEAAVFFHDYHLYLAPAI